MKNDKKWLKESINELKTIFNGRNMSGYEVGMLDGYNHVSMLIDHLDEPEKPVIPQFVADFIEKWKNEGLTMDEWFEFNYDDEDEQKVSKWLYDNDYEENTTREHLLIDATRYGYEVKEEQKYRVIDRHNVYLLAKEEERNKVETVAELVEIYGHEYVELNYQLTEQEIKDYDERFWTFAVKIEELEE